MKSYAQAQKEKTPAPPKPTPSGVTCAEVECKGEMMYVEPSQFHPELKELKRAICDKCSWRGWC